MEHVTGKLQKSYLRRQHTGEEMEGCSFLATEAAQRKGDK